MQPWANGDDGALLRLFLGGVRDDDATPRLLFAFEAPYDDTIMQWAKCHFAFLPDFTPTSLGSTPMRVPTRIFSREGSRLAKGIAAI
jgi:hypothetical protein